MSEMKPARKYFLKALPARDGNGFIAQFAAPGLVPDFVREGRGGPPALYEDEETAIAQAGEVLCALLNNRPRDPNKKETWKRLTGPELANALQDAGLTPTEFAYLYGTSQDRVLRWIDGELEIPHPVRIILTLFLVPGNLAIARNTTSLVTERKEKT